MNQPEPWARIISVAGGYQVVATIEYNDKGRRVVRQTCWIDDNKARITIVPKADISADDLLADDVRMELYAKTIVEQLLKSIAQDQSVS